MSRLKCCLIMIIILVVSIISPINPSKAYEKYKVETPTVMRYDNSEEMTSAIRLKEMGILLDQGKGFELYKESTRLDGVIIYINLIRREEEIKGYEDVECKFSDVPEWGVRYVNYALDNQLIQETGSTTFGSQTIIDANVGASFLLTALGYSESLGDFKSNSAIDKCVSLGMITKSESDRFISGKFTRGLLAVLTCRALDTTMKSGQEKLGVILERLKPLEDRGFSVLKMGARGDGKTNDTLAIQRAISKYDKVFIPDGIYMIDGTIGLKPGSNQVISLSENAVLKIISNNLTFHFMFSMSNVSNTLIEGGTITGDRYLHTDNKAEGGTGIRFGANNNSVTIKNMKIERFLGDGITLDDETISKNITLESIISRENRGQGVYITNAKDVFIKDSLFENSNREGYETGICIRTNKGCAIQNISITNTWSLNNSGDGIIVNGVNEKITNVGITDCLFSGNENGIYLNSCGNIKVADTELSYNAEHGMNIVKDLNKAEFSKLVVSNNGSRGISMVVTKQTIGTKGINFDTCDFLNNSQKKPGENDGIRIDIYDSRKELKQVKFTNCRFFNDQKVYTQRYGISVAKRTGISDIVVETTCLFKDNLLKDLLSNNLVSFKPPEFYNGYLNICDAGAVGDGATDDTDAIQRALNASKNIVIPRGVYMIDTKKGLNVTSNQTIEFEEDAIFNAIPNAEIIYSIFNIKDVTKVKITGGILKGDRYEHFLKSGEWGGGINIGSNSNEICIKGMRLECFNGDGIYIGGKIVPKGITIEDVVCDNNMRAGLSVTGVKNLEISNSEFLESNGKKPQTGINMEPNKGSACTDITMSGITCAKNSGDGISILGIESTIKNVKISDSKITQNTDGIYLDNCDGIVVDSSEITRNRNYGICFARDISNGTFDGMSIASNNARGISVVTTNQSKGILNLKFNKCNFSNNGQSRTNEVDGLRIDLFDDTGVIKNIRINTCSFFDDQIPPTQRYGISINENKKVTGILINRNCTFKGNIKGGIKKAKLKNS